MDHLEELSGGAPPGFRSMGPPVEVRGRRATRGVFAVSVFHKKCLSSRFAEDNSRTNPSTYALH